MKNVIVFAVLCLFSLSLPAGQQASGTSGVEDLIKKQEQNWATGDGEGWCGCRGSI